MVTYSKEKCKLSIPPPGLPGSWRLEGWTLTLSLRILALILLSRCLFFTVIIEAILPQLLQDMYLLLPCLLPLVPTRILALRCLPQEEQLEELLSQTKEMVDIVDVLEQARTAKVFIGIGM